MLFRSPRVLELLSMLTWWAFPVDEWAALGFLRAPWVDVPPATLDSWKKNSGSFEPFWESDHPVARCLAPHRSSAIRPGELLALLIEDAGLEAELSELSQSLLSLWHRCEKLSLQGCDFVEAVRRLQDSIRGGGREKEVPPPANRGVLPILTVHASKEIGRAHV